jgi:hypothetical protein
MLTGSKSPKRRYRKALARERDMQTMKPNWKTTIKRQDRYTIRVSFTGNREKWDVSRNVDGLSGFRLGTTTNSVSESPRNKREEGNRGKIKANKQTSKQPNPQTELKQSRTREQNRTEQKQNLNRTEPEQKNREMHR